MLHYCAIKKRESMNQFELKDVGQIKAGLVIEIVEFGMEVCSEGKIVFIPASLSGILDLDESPKSVLRYFLGKTIFFKLKLAELPDPNRTLIGGSVVDAIKDLRRNLTPVRFQDVQISGCYEGYIERVSEHGIFVDIGGVLTFVYKTHLLYLSEHPLQFYIPGNRITIRVIEIDYDKKRISSKECREFDLDYGSNEEIRTSREIYALSQVLDRNDLRTVNQFVKWLISQKQ